MVNEINFYSRKVEHGWLSNFWRCKIVINGIEYPSTEHYYQSQKTHAPELQKWIASSPSPYTAMQAGRSLRKHEFVSSWDTIKVHVMLVALRAKFTQNEDLRTKLLETGTAVLHEDSPTDMFWGKRGKDMLGRLLMRVRKEIRTGVAPSDEEEWF